MTGTDIAWAAAALVLLGALAFEVGQRVSDRLKRGRRRGHAGKSPQKHMFYTVSERGVPLADRPGTVVLALHPYLLYRARPDQHLSGLTINAQGYRGADWTLEKRPGSTRVLVVGSSIAFGWGVADEHVFPLVLEKLLREVAPPGRHVEVLNGAGLGYNSSQQLVALAADLLDYAPDVIVISGGLIDFNAGRLASGDSAPVNPVFDRVEDVLVQGTRHVQNFARLSALYRGLERKVGALLGATGEMTVVPQVACAMPGRDHARGAARYRRTLERMVGLGRAAGAQVLILTEAESHLRRVDPVPELERAIRASKGPLYEEAVVARYPLYAQAGEEVARALGVEHLDLTPVLHDVRQPLFVDWVHPNELGHELIAKAIAPSVARLAGLPSLTEKAAPPIL